MLGLYNAVRIAASYDELWRHYSILHAGRYGLTPLVIDIASQWACLFAFILCFAGSFAITDERRTKLDLLLRGVISGIVSVYLPPALLDGWFWLVT